jgi:glutaredoxin
MTTERDSDAEMAARVNLVLGTTLMVVGSSLAVLIFADKTGQPLDWMPQIWFATRHLHVVLCLIVFGFAAIVLKLPARELSNGDSNEALFNSVRFYTRGNCELCVTALATVRTFENKLGDFEVIDIDHDQELRQRFNDCVPVLEIDGKVRFRGIIKPELLERLIEGARIQRQRSAAEMHEGAETETHRSNVRGDDA